MIFVFRFSSFRFSSIEPFNLVEEWGKRKKQARRNDYLAISNLYFIIAEIERRNGWTRADEFITFSFHFCFLLLLISNLKMGNNIKIFVHFDFPRFAFPAITKGGKHKFFGNLFFFLAHIKLMLCVTIAIKCHTIYDMQKSERKAKTIEIGINKRKTWMVPFVRPIWMAAETVRAMLQQRMYFTMW